MLNGLYSAAAGMTAQQERMDALANDIANVNTAGYRAVRVAFRDLVYAADGTGAGSAVSTIGRSFGSGAFVETGDPLNVAIEGPGYFQVKRADGSIALTRAGNLRLDANGEVVTPTGERLEPPIKVPVGTSAGEVSIAADGTVTIETARLGKLAVVDVPAPNGLQPVGDNLFVTTQASGAAAELPRTAVRQGVLESSNVDLGTAMVDVLDAQRGFELASRAIRTQDELMEIANGIRR